MENEKTDGKIRINDGGGLYDSDGLIDTIVIDLNNLTKALVSGEFVQYSGLIFQMYQKMQRLKTGINRDREKLVERVEYLKRLTDELSGNASGEGGTAENGHGDADRQG